MNSITLVTLPKKFSFMRWRLFGAFSMIIAAIPKNVFFYEVEPFVSILSKYIRTLIQSKFHVVGMLYSIIDVYDLNQSIFWDTLYGKNSLWISISVYLGPKDTKSLSLINFFFWESNNNDWSHIFPFLVYVMSIFGHPVWYWGQKAPKKNPTHKGKLFRGATLLMEVLYLNF